jgi:hypothetical protein
MRSPFALLARHFFGRFFDNEIVSQEGDLRTNMVQALALVAVPSMFVPFFMLPQRVRFHVPFQYNWLLVSDYYFFVVYSMVVMGLVMVFEWDALFPDRQDYVILTPLPLGEGAVFAGKAAALLLFLGIFVLDVNCFGIALTPLVSVKEGTPPAIVWRILGAHAAAVISGGVFVCLVFAGLQGILINVLTARAFRRVSPWVQMGAMGLLVLALFLTPLACATVKPLFESRSPILRWAPPFWFLSLYMDLLPGRPGGEVFHQLAPRAWTALEIAGAVFAAAYLAGYRRHARRVMESLDATFRGPGRARRALERAANRWLLPDPLERATFHFISNTMLRSARHRLLIAAYSAMAVALAVPAVVRIGTRAGGPMLVLAPAGFLAIPLTLSFFAVTGLRAAFNIPVELRANWTFRMCESAERTAPIRAARKWVIAMGLVPLFAVLAPLEILFRGWKLGGIHLTFAMVLSIVLLNLLLVWFRKIPFTCSYFPGKTSLAVMALLYFAGFLAYSSTMASLQLRLLPSAAGLALFYAAAFAAIAGLARLEKREFQVDDALIYEDRPDPIVRTLELG